MIFWIYIFWNTIFPDLQWWKPDVALVSVSYSSQLGKPPKKGMCCYNVTVGSQVITAFTECIRHERWSGTTGQSIKFWLFKGKDSEYAIYRSKTQSLSKCTVLRQQCTSAGALHGQAATLNRPEHTDISQCTCFLGASFISLPIPLDLNHSPFFLYACIRKHTTCHI